MSSARPAVRPPDSDPDRGSPGLHSGDRMDQPTFDALCERTPPGFKAEPIEGTVYVASPTSPDHSLCQSKVKVWLGQYWRATPGVEVHDNVTIVLDDEDEPQPDCALVVKPGQGGRVRARGNRFVGPPELVVEVAFSSRAVDLNAKLRAYERAGVLEYLVVVVFDEALRWFAPSDGRFEPVPPGPDGLLRSSAFPGLQLNPSAFFGAGIGHTLDVALPGLNTPEHAAFVDRLAAARTPDA